jgi:small-conductance mechanosensitive channel
MFKKIFILAILIGTVSVLWLINLKLQIDLLEKSFNTVLVILVTYAIFKLILQEITIKKIKDSKTRYSLKKTISIVFMLISAFAISGIWIKNPQTLLVSYGLLAAGLAVALQDLLKNFIGSLTIIFNRLFSVGDRIEIKGKRGDVIDIGILYTSLLEIREWMSADQPTGRIALVPNGAVLKNDVKNYNKDHAFIWDEMMIPIAYGSNWKKAQKIMYNIVKKEIKPSLEKVEKSLTRLSKKYFFEGREIKPRIFMKFTDNWIRFDIRYPVAFRERSVTADILSQKILEKLEETKDIEISSATIEISAWPDLKMKKIN